MKQKLIVYIVFAGLFLLAMDFWGWNQTTSLFFGLPLWVYYLLFLTLATSIAFLILAKYHWRDNQ